MDETDGRRLHHPEEPLVARDSPLLPLGVKLGWALGQLPIASHVGVVSFYLLFFMTSVHHIPPAWAGIALLLPRLFNIFFDPLMGAISDKTNTRFGKRRPYLLAGSLLWAISFTALFALPRQSDSIHDVTYMFVAFLTVSIGQTLYHVPYSAMQADMAKSDRDRIGLASWKETVSRIGILIAATTAPALVALFSSQAAGYRAAGIVFGLVIAAGGFIAFFATVRAPRDDAVTTRSVRYRDQLRATLSNRPFCILVASYVAIMAADEIFSSSLVYYAVNVLGETEAFVGKAYPISSIAAVLCIPLWNTAAVRFGRRTALTWAIVGMASCWLSILAVRPDAAWMMYPLMAVGGAFNAGLLIMPNAMVPDIVDYDARKVGYRREGALYGAWIFCQQSAMAAGGFILSLALSGIGYSSTSTVQGPSVPVGLRLVISVIPAGLLLLALLLVRTYPLADRRQTEAELRA